MTTAQLLAADGILLPESTLQTGWFSVLAAFVAINTVMYVALAIAKVLPKVYPRDWLPRRYTRSETRSIYPETPEGEQAKAAAATDTRLAR
ncbi:hypothetical protein [Cumulibacter manganitolerans]|uniref:hypothetical protein n=1 Tax=Cumulibacter manganitolerans TaxID=1884992 RepID=UPI001296D8A6|nr:hypothetical protein [Cumulibacter manganitolerans]